VIGELVGKRTKASDRIERAAADRDRRTEARLRQNEGKGCDHIRQEFIACAHGRKRGPAIAVDLSRIKTAHGSDASAGKRTYDSAQPVRRYRDVAVADHDDIVPRGAHHVYEVRDLAVGPMLSGVHHELDVRTGIVADQPLHDAYGGITRILDAEYDLYGCAVTLLQERG